MIPHSSLAFISFFSPFLSFSRVSPRALDVRARQAMHGARQARSAGVNPLTQKYADPAREAEQVRREEEHRRQSARWDADNLTSSLVPRADARVATFGRTLETGPPAPGAVAMRTAAEAMRESYEFNTITQRYRTSEREHQALAFDESLRAARASTLRECTTRPLRDRLGYDIISGAGGPPVPAGRRVQPVTLSRYDFDVLTGLPKGAESAVPTAPSTAAPTQTERPLRRRGEQPVVRTFDIVNGAPLFREPVVAGRREPVSGKRRVVSSVDHSDMLVWHDAKRREEPPLESSYDFYDTLPEHKRPAVSRSKPRR